MFRAASRAEGSKARSSRPSFAKGNCLDASEISRTDADSRVYERPKHGLEQLENQLVGILIVPNRCEDRRSARAALRFVCIGAVHPTTAILGLFAADEKGGSEMVEQRRMNGGKMCQRQNLHGRERRAPRGSVAAIALASDCTHPGVSGIGMRTGTRWSKWYTRRSSKRGKRSPSRGACFHRGEWSASSSARIRSDAQSFFQTYWWWKKYSEDNENWKDEDD